MIYKCYSNKHSIKRTKVGITMITQRIFIGAGFLLLIVIPQDLFLTNLGISVSSAFCLICSFTPLSVSLMCRSYFFLFFLFQTVKPYPHYVEWTKHSWNASIYGVNGVHIMEYLVKQLKSKPKTFDNFHKILQLRTTPLEDGIREYSLAPITSKVQVIFFSWTELFQRLSFSIKVLKIRLCSLN